MRERYLSPLSKKKKMEMTVVVRDFHRRTVIGKADDIFDVHNKSGSIFTCCCFLYKRQNYLKAKF